MEVWSWILGYAVLFAVVQLAIYAYYVRQGEGTPSASGAGDADDYQHIGDRIEREPLAEDGVNDDALDGPDAPPRRDGDAEMRACPHCGTPNETTGTIRYCRHCTRSLG